MGKPSSGFSLSASLPASLTCLVSYLWVPGIRPLVSTRVLAGPGLNPPLGRSTVLGWWGGMVLGCGGSYSEWTRSHLGEAGQGRGRGVLLSLSFESPLGPGVSRSHLNGYRYSLR